jgi:hypothetical protein
LSFDAFVVSALITTTLWLVVLVGPAMVYLPGAINMWNDTKFHLLSGIYLPVVFGYIGVLLIMTILSDYVSLLFVRRYLTLEPTQ